MSNKVALVTGASSGIGRETVLELKKRGFIVYGGARRIDRMNNLKGQDINTIYLDVTNDESMVNCVKHVLDNEGQIDVLVNNAGYGSYGAIEDVDIKEAYRQFDVNVFGLGRMVQLVMPIMRKNGHGKIVNISSMGGRVSTPFGGWYYASKYAVEGFSDCLRMEVKDFGIDVILIEPGLVKSEWSHIASEKLKNTSLNGAFAENARKYADKLSYMYSKNAVTSPKIIAETIGKAVSVRRPKTRYLVGYSAKLCIFLHSIFGDRIYDKIIKKMML